MTIHRAAVPRLPAGSGWLRGWRRWALVSILAALCAVLVLLAPVTAGTSWAQVARVLSTIDPRWWPLLTATWLAQLWAHAVAMAACLPGMRRRQAMRLSLAGSAVANSVPLGGAVSLALTTAMTRSWGFRPAAVTTFLLLTHVWNMLSRLLFGGLAGIGLLFVGTGVAISVPAMMLAAGLIAAVLVVAWMLTSDGALLWIGQTATGLEHALRSRWRPLAQPRGEQELGQSLQVWQRQVGTLLRGSWARLSLGMAGNLALLALLLGLCLRGLGIAAPALLVLAAVGIERLVTAEPITPGGVGTAELSLVACLSGGGVPGAKAVAAAVLFRIFTFFAEIPVGAVVALAWHLRRRTGLAVLARTAPKIHHTS